MSSIDMGLDYDSTVMLDYKYTIRGSTTVGPDTPRNSCLLYRRKFDDVVYISSEEKELLYEIKAEKVNIRHV